jgi:hypothetical protein
MSCSSGVAIVLGLIIDMDMSASCVRTAGTVKAPRVERHTHNHVLSVEVYVARRVDALDGCARPSCSLRSAVFTPLTVQVGVGRRPRAGQKNDAAKDMSTNVNTTVFAAVLATADSEGIVV